MHILVVDDQAAARQFFDKILKDWGHTAQAKMTKTPNL